MSLLLRKCCCPGAGGDCCRVGKVCFGTPTASTLRAAYALVNSIDLSEFGYSSTSKVFAGLWEGQTADYVTYAWEESGPPGGWSTLGCAEVRTGWMRLGATGMGGSPGDFPIDVWVRLTAWYAADDTWHIKAEFAGAADGSGTIVSVEDSKALGTSQGLSANKSPAAWSNGSAGSWAIANPTTCCRNGTTCRTAVEGEEPIEDSVGVYCCAFRYMTIGGCIPFAELLADKVIRVSDGEKHFTVGGYRFFLTAPEEVPPGQYFCDVPAGKTLLTPSGFAPEQWMCVPYYRCSAPDGTTATPASLVAPGRLAINEYGSIFTGADGVETCGGGVFKQFGNAPFLDGVSGSWVKDEGTNMTECWDPIENWGMPDVAGWCAIAATMVLVSTCAYYNPIGWDEELGEPIMELVPAEHYYEATIHVGCGAGGVFQVSYRAAFDPEDPKTPGEVGNFAHAATSGSPPVGMTVAPTVSFTDLW